MEPWIAFLARAEKLMDRIEAVLPHPTAEPDWGASIAFRYRRRSSGHGVIAPIQHVGAMGLDDLQEIDPQKEKIVRHRAGCAVARPAPAGAPDRRPRPGFAAACGRPRAGGGTRYS